MLSSNCRSCGKPLRDTFVDLGMSPLANSYLQASQLDQQEQLYPLHVYVCRSCFLVQLVPVNKPEDIFSDYAYFSSFSESWLKHAKSYVESVIDRFHLTEGSFVLEIASNDGYLLQYFVARNIPVLGIEPAKNVADTAISRGISTLVRFFSQDVARELMSEGKFPNLVIGNNVLAHVPELNDFVKALKMILREGGVITLEFPHLLRLIAENQFDTIYHEHVFYFSLIAIQTLIERHGLTVFDVEELPTHGGSLRIYATHRGDSRHPVKERVTNLLAKENTAGLSNLKQYVSFSEKVMQAKRRLLDFLLIAKREGKTVVGYGAPAKGNTLLNYCGIGADFLDYTVDRSPHKQGMFLPGTHIPIYHPDRIRETKPNYVLILPWNLQDEITAQMDYIRRWGGRFVVPIPETTVI